LRITRADVLAEALAILGDAVESALADDERYDPLGTASMSFYEVATTTPVG